MSFSGPRFALPRYTPRILAKAGGFGLLTFEAMVAGAKGALTSPAGANRWRAFLDFAVELLGDHPDLSLDTAPWAVR